MTPSPRPWTVFVDELEGSVTIQSLSANYHQIARMDTTLKGLAPRSMLAEANAAYIVRCVNAHEKLVEACTIALGAFEHNNAIDWNILRAALAAAETPPSKE